MGGLSVCLCCGPPPEEKKASAQCFLACPPIWRIVFPATHFQTKGKLCYNKEEGKKKHREVLHNSRSSSSSSSSSSLLWGLFSGAFGRKRGTDYLIAWKTEREEAKEWEFNLSSFCCCAAASSFWGGVVCSRLPGSTTTCPPVVSYWVLGMGFVCYEGISNRIFSLDFGNGCFGIPLKVNKLQWFMMVVGGGECYVGHFWANPTSTLPLYHTHFLSKTSFCVFCWKK